MNDDRGGTTTSVSPVSRSITLEDSSRAYSRASVAAWSLRSLVAAFRVRCGSNRGPNSTTMRIVPASTGRPMRPMLKKLTGG